MPFCDHFRKLFSQHIVRIMITPQIPKEKTGKMSMFSYPPFPKRFTGTIAVEFLQRQTGVGVKDIPKKPSAKKSLFGMSFTSTPVWKELFSRITESTEQDPELKKFLERKGNEDIYKNFRNLLKTLGDERCTKMSKYPDLDLIYILWGLGVGLKACSLLLKEIDAGGFKTVLRCPDPGNVLWGLGMGLKNDPVLLKRMQQFKIIHLINHADARRIFWALGIVLKDKPDLLDDWSRVDQILKCPDPGSIFWVIGEASKISPDLLLEKKLTIEQFSRVAKHSDPVSSLARLDYTFRNASEIYGDQDPSLDIESFFRTEMFQ